MAQYLGTVHHLEIKRQMGQGDIAAVSELLEVAAQADGHRPLGEHQWLDLVEGCRAGFAGLVAWEPGHDHPVGYAQVTRGESSWALEFVVDPHHRDQNCGIGQELVATALQVVREEGGGHIHLWVPKPTAEHDQIADATGLRRGRDLMQLRRPLPPPGGCLSALTTRPFRPGEDETAWLQVNNRAFADHPEQGGWDLATLCRREAEPWFDPAGFLLHERDGKLAGFCWTKVHGDLDPPLGEIYVVAVDPDLRGLNLGHELMVAGMAHLVGRGLGVAMLYVDADNGPARRLYDELGFQIDHIDRAYVGDVEPAP
ncbi:MAG: mycothiol synthase [Acidimicrobiales bacterium]